MAITRINSEYAPHFWYGNTGNNTYVDIPVSNLSSSYRRQGIWVFYTPNNNGHGGLAYVGVSNSGEITTASTVFRSSTSQVQAVSASTNKSNNTVRVTVGTAWATVFAISDLNIG